MSTVELVPLVDVSLDLRGVRRAAQRRGLTLAFAAGHLPGATHIELGTLADHAEALPASPTVVMCGHGERAMGGASLLERAGHRDLAVLQGGPEDWGEVTGRSLEV
ncbi:rhodanese-like domain-containing protein [Saccharopolyspora sp. NPDC003752]